MNWFGKCTFIFLIFLCGLTADAGQEPNFSATRYSIQRKVVKKLLKEEIKEALTVSEEPIQIDIALIDLNKDGKEEILAYVRNPYFCGVDGCWFMVLMQEGRSWRNILQLIIREEVSVSKSTTSGFVDLIIENKSIWGWNGKRYQYLRSLGNL